MNPGRHINCMVKSQVAQEMVETHTKYQSQLFENNTCTVCKIKVWSYFKLSLLWYAGGINSEWSGKIYLAI